MALDLSHEAAAGATSMAPAKPLQTALKTPKPLPSSLPDWLKSQTTNLEKEHETVWRELYYTWELIGHFMEGRQVLRRSNRTGRWRVSGGPKSTADPVQALPVLGFYSRALLAKWVQSRVRTKVIGIDDSDAATYTANAGNAILPYLEERIYTERFNQEECLNAQMSGCFARYAYYDPDADGGIVERQITQPQSMPMGESVGSCADCGNSHPYPPDQPPSTACPDCGSANYAVEQAPTVNIDAVVGTEKQKVGLPVGEQVPFFELRFDLAYPLEKSPFLCRSRRLRKKVVETAFPGLKVTQGHSHDEIGVESQGRLKTSTPLGGRGYAPDSATEDEICTFKQWWFDPVMYNDTILKEDIQTVSGATIPAGTALKDQFPDGMYFAYVPGTDKILEMFNEHHRDHWVSSPYHVKLMSGLGYGIHEALEAQRQSNLLYNQVWTKARASATPGIAYDASVFSPDVARDLGMPQKNLPANTGHLPDNKRISDSIFPIPAGSFGQELIWYSNELRSVMQLSSGAIDFAQGMPGVNNNTATGAQLGASLANLQQEPVLALRAEANERFGMILLKLWQKHCHDQRYVTLKGQDGQLDGKYFSSADLASTFIVKAEPGSWKTQSDAEARENMTKFLQAVQLLGQSATPTAIRQISNVFGVDFEASPYKDQGKLSRIRLEQMKAQVPQAQQVVAATQQQQAIAQQQGIVQTDPMTGQPVPPPDPNAIAGQQLAGIIDPPILPEEPGHKESWEWYQYWLLRDEGIEADKVLRAAVCVLIRTHMQAMVQFQEEQAQIQMPLQMMQAQMQQQAAPQGAQPQPTAGDKAKQSAAPNMKAPKPGGSADGQNGPPKQPRPSKASVPQPPTGA
jgi:hypothetical protein